MHAFGVRVTAVDQLSFCKTSEFQELLTKVINNYTYTILKSDSINFFIILKKLVEFQDVI